MKKLIGLLSVLVVLLSVMGGWTVAAAAGADISASRSTVTIGDTVTVTAKFNGGDAGIGALDATFYYNADTFEYISCVGANSSDPASCAGVVTISHFATEMTPPTSLTITLTLKAIATGEGKFKWVTNGMYDDLDNLLATPGKELNVIASNPTMSGNANLKSLIPSYGSLSPRFSPDVTEYTISVDHTVTSMPLTFHPQDSGATTSIEGSKALPEGATSHTRVITVTAPNGTTKKYTVVIHRAAPPSTTTTTTNSTDTTVSDPTGTDPSVPPPSEDSLEVEADGKHMTILDTQAPIKLPEGFEWSTLSIHTMEVPAAVHAETGMLLLYLVSDNEADSGLYIYNVAEDSFARYRQLTTDGNSYLLYNVPLDLDAPAGTTLGRLTIGEHEVTAYLYEDGALSDFCILWASLHNGDAGWYTYDRQEGTFQRYHATPGQEISTPTTAKTNKTTKATVSQTTAGEKTPFSFAAFIKQPRNVILLGGVALVLVVVIVTVILLVVSLGKQKHSKH